MSESIILTKFEDLSETILNPLKQTQRIKYTTSDISQNFIVFGATSGSLYLFERDPCKFIQIIPNSNGAVNQIAISNDENYIAFSTFKGTICVVTLDTIESCTTQIVAQHENSLVTCFYWDKDCDDKKLYYGDSMGNVVLIQLSYLLGRSMLHTSTHSILLLENSIVQIHGYDKLLLVSTTTKCVLCNAEKEEFKQIGNKPRDGEYGACFIIPSDHNDIMKLKIYCARPGMRLWEVDIEGNVLQTHQLKNYLTNILPTKVLINNDINNKTDILSTTSSSPSSSSSNDLSFDINNIDLINSEDNNKLINNSKIVMQFSKLYSFCNNYLFAYTENLIIIFDTEHRIINLINNQFLNIKQLYFVVKKNLNHDNNNCYDDKYLYILNKNMKLSIIKFYFLNEYLIKLYQSENYIECYNIIKKNIDYFLNVAVQNNNNNINIIKVLKSLNDIFLKLNLLNNNNDDDEGNDNNNNVNKLFEKLNEQPNIINVNNDNYNNGKSDAAAHAGDDDDSDNKKNIKHEIVIVNNKQNNITTQFKLNNKLLALNSVGKNNCDSNIDEENIIWNLYMIYKTSKISNTNFIERYTIIFDKYELKFVINLIEKLKNLLYENETDNLGTRPNDNININCIKLFFDYLKIEMIWEIGDCEREYIMKSFITINTNINCNINNNLKCNACKFPLKIMLRCEYKDIGLMLLQYYWSRKEYNICFDLCSHVTYLLRCICKFYIDEKDFNNIIPYCIVIGDIEILLKAIDTFAIENWYEFYDFFNLYQLNCKKSRVYCLKCKEFNEIIYSDIAVCDKQSCDRFVVENDDYFIVNQLSWNVIVNLSLDCIKGLKMLKLIEKYSETITNEVIDRRVYLRCLLEP